MIPPLRQDVFPRRVPLIASGGFSDLNNQRFNWQQQNLQTSENNRRNLQDWVWKSGVARAQREEANQRAIDSRTQGANEDNRFRFLQAARERDAARAQADAYRQEKRSNEVLDRNFKFGVDSRQAEIDYKEADYELRRQAAEKGYDLQSRQLDDKAAERRFEFRVGEAKQFDARMSDGTLMPREMFEHELRRNVPPAEWSYYRNQYDNNLAISRNQYTNAEQLAEYINAMVDRAEALDAADPEAGELEALQTSKEYTAAVKEARNVGIMVNDGMGRWSVRVSPQMAQLLEGEDQFSSGGGQSQEPQGEPSAPAAPTVQAAESDIPSYKTRFGGFRMRGGVPIPSGLGFFGNKTLPPEAQKPKVFPLPLNGNGRIDIDSLRVGEWYIHPTYGAAMWDGENFDDGK